MLLVFLVLLSENGTNISSGHPLEGNLLLGKHGHSFFNSLFSGFLEIVILVYVDPHLRKRFFNVHGSTLVLDHFIPLINFFRHQLLVTLADEFIMVDEIRFVALGHL